MPRGIRLSTGARLTRATVAPLCRTVHSCSGFTLVHGDRAYHNELVGRDAFDDKTRNLRRLVGAGVRTSVQTTVVAGGTWVVDWVADLCLDVGVRRLSILPFIPRGSGYGRRSDYGLSDSRRGALPDSRRHNSDWIIGRDAHQTAIARPLAGTCNAVRTLKEPLLSLTWRQLDDIFTPDLQSLQGNT